LARFKQWQVAFGRRSTFQVFVTVDKNLVQQQNLTVLQIAVVIIRAPSNKIEDLSPLFRRFLLCCRGLVKGSSLLSAELK
jgi:hypothetical protein